MSSPQHVFDESFQAAKLIVRYFSARLDEEELIPAFRHVRDLIAEAMERVAKRRAQERLRLGKSEYENAS